MLDVFNNMTCSEVQTTDKKEDVYQIKDALYEYQNDIKDYTVLTKEEEEILFKKYHQASGQEKKKIRNEIASHYLKFVIYVAKMYKNNFLSFEDMVSEGNIGLLKAIDKFDETKGIRFTTYSIYWIKVEITRNAYNQNRLISVPSHIEEKLSKYIRFVETYISEFKVNPKREEVSRQMNMSIKEILELEKILINPASFSNPINSDNERSGVLLDFIPNEDAVNPELEIEKNDMKDQIQEILKDLTEVERELILIKYGFYDNKKKTLEETASILHEKGYTKKQLGREGVRLREKKILQKLRKPRYIKQLEDYSSKAK